MGYNTIIADTPPFAMGPVSMSLSSIQLSAVSVVADNALLHSDRNVYIPTSRQRNASRDAADLLRRMAIPQLVINPGDNSIKDLLGNSVAVCINYHAAERDELNGLYNNTDVFSRFTYRRMTYDIYAGSDNQDYSHAGADNTAKYHLDDDSGPVTVDRRESIDRSDVRSNRYPVTFRATYATSRF